MARGKRPIEDRILDFRLGMRADAQLEVHDLLEEAEQEIIRLRRTLLAHERRAAEKPAESKA